MTPAWWRRWRERRALARRAIPDSLWQATLRRYPFISRRRPEELARLRTLCTLFLDHKEFAGANGFVVNDEIAVAIAAQACLPVLELGLACYSRFVGIVVHADEVVARRERMDDHGIVHHYDEVLTGEAMQGGPVMLSWSDAQAAGAASGAWAYNVVIHEFAHVLDMTDGMADGVPAGVDRAAWTPVLMREFDAFSERVVCGHDTVLDPYGAEGPEEFFAVASEGFFVTPQALKEEQPALYRLLSSYYRQDPAA